jgi:hypothetical protein
VASSARGAAGAAADDGPALERRAASVGKAIADAHARGLADSRQWRALVHYRPTMFGGWKSEADCVGFFLAGRAGRTDPRAELDATIAALLAPPPRAAPKPPSAQPSPSPPTPPSPEHAQCLFPARWQWLKQALALSGEEVVDVACPTFEEWHRGIAAQAITLVYATAYLNSPASMYGHTFFRLSRATGEGNPLLDYVINFAADVDTNNGLIYAVKGVTGGFRGLFYVMPYYVKVQEYSNMESRDLWEYELALSPAQVDTLVRHVWETRTTHFDYYFFTRNCSYQLLSLLEVADPSLDLVSHFTTRVIPSDTVRVVLRDTNLVGRRRPRPSIVSVMNRRKARLSSAEVQVAERFALAADAGALPTDALAGFAKERQALILDAAYDYFRYRQGLSVEPTLGYKKKERRLLLARGRVGVPPQDVASAPGIDAPERGHDSLRVGLGAGTSDQSGWFQTVSVRGAIHDYLDSARGYPRDAQLAMGNLALRFNDQARRLSVDHVDLIDIVSASPLDRWVKSLSWKVWLGVDNARELGCERGDSDRRGCRCLYAGATTGGGGAVRFGPEERFLLFALVETDAAAGPAFKAGERYRVGGGVEAGLVAEAGPRCRFLLGAREILYFLGDRRENRRARVAGDVTLTRGLDLRVGVDVAGTYADVTGQLLAYF